MLKKIALSLLASAAFLFAAELPTPEAVFNKYVEATGGKAAYDKVKAMRSKGSVEFQGAGLKGTVVVTMAHPDKADTVMDLAGIGTLHMGSGGGIAWQTSAIQGPRLLDGEERDKMLRSSVIDGPVHWRETYGEVKVDGEETLDGKACWRLISLAPKATKPETLWFEKDSGLLVKTSSVTVSPMGEIAVETRMQDYRDVGGLKVPYSSRISTGPQVLVLTMSEVTLNPDLPANQFDLPEDIQALVSHK